MNKMAVAVVAAVAVVGVAVDVAVMVVVATVRNSSSTYAACMFDVSSVVEEKF